MIARMFGRVNGITDFRMTQIWCIPREPYALGLYDMDEQSSEEGKPHASERKGT